MYHIEVIGDQRWVDGSIETSADGYAARYDAVSKCYVAAGRCRSYLNSKLRVVTARANWMQLSCGIGEFVTLLQLVSENKDRMLPLQEDDFNDTLFAVGKSITFNASYSGELVCFANDSDSLYLNNKGSLTVTVRRVSWPPLKGGYRDGNSTKWPLRYRWPAQNHLSIEGYRGPI